MREKIFITRATLVDKSKLEFQVESEKTLKDFIASGKMLVDSDGISFIYLLEKSEEYTYVVIDEKYWKQLNEALSEEALVFITNGKEQIELVNIFDELSYLVENIKGNSNYGNEMVAKVEAVF